MPTWVRKSIPLFALLLGFASLGVLVKTLPLSLGQRPATGTASNASADTAAATDCQRPYSDDSPWNTKIGPQPRYHPRSKQLITALEGPFGSNPDTYTYPVYTATNRTPVQTVYFSGIFSEVTEDGTKLELRQGGGRVEVPIPAGALPSRGTDAQIIVINNDTGDEWGFWQARPIGRAAWQAVNGYHYNTRWSGVPPAGFASRGARVPYLAGLIRKCEIERGYINHAIAFAYDYPCNRQTCAWQGLPHFVYPAQGSDGKGTYRYDFPEGTRLQLDPNASEQDVQRWCGSDRACRTIVKALQEYGMITIDNSGHPKIYPEYSGTAQWGTLLADKTPSRIPYAAFRVLDFEGTE